jgi:hypothetical protein
MTVSMTKTFVRPSADILWHTEVIPWSLQQPSYALYIAEGKLISETITNPDSLTRVVDQVWDSIESFDAFCVIPDVIEYTDLRNAYNVEHGITFDRIIE